ncbi:MAG: S-layer homology domain-containing protein [Clostridia bacterium]|nr:S-layer homology domain-containing protein [Clostridia bacterium]
MKTSKRILSLLLSVVLLVSCLGTVVLADTTETQKGKFTDVAADSLYANAVETLSLLGVINGYPDGSFKPEQNVTRAEFTAMLMRTLNFGSLGSASASALPFTDVDDSDSSINWSIPNINVAYDKGIINGYEDNTFRPKNNVAYEEALKMIVCTLGYTGIDTSTTPWYANFVAQANQLGVTKFASQLGSAETPANRACIAQMLYDSLDVALFENGVLTNRTILKDYQGYIRNTGIISANADLSLTEADGVYLGKDEIQIYAQEKTTGLFETKTYKLSDTSLAAHIGKEIEFYYKDNGSTRTLAFAILTPSKEVTVDVDRIDLSSSNNNQIRYYASETATSVTPLSLDAQNTVVYNGKLYGANPAGSRFDLAMLPQLGSVTFLDSDNDNDYDIVTIKGYEVYYVSSKVTSEFSIVDSLTALSPKTLVLNVEDPSIKTTIVDKNGNNLLYNSIAAGNIICLARSTGIGGSLIQTAVVLRDSFSGKITGKQGSSSITVNGKSYEYSVAAPWVTGVGTLTEPVLNESATFYTDIDGRIVAYKKDAVSSNVFYGFVMGMANSDSVFGTEKLVQVLTQTGSQATLILNNQTRINGSGYSASTHDAQLLYRPIKYTVGSGTGAYPALATVVTASTPASGQTPADNTLLSFTPVGTPASYTYSSSAKQLSASGKSVSVGNAIIFVVPGTDKSDFELYSKSTASSQFRQGKPYTVEIFDVNSANAAGLVVYYGADTTTSVDAYTPVSVIAEAPVKELSNGREMDSLKGFSSSGSAPKGSLNTYLSPDSPVRSLQLGDIFRAASDRYGATVNAADLLYSVNGGNTWGVTTKSSAYADLTIDKLHTSSALFGLVKGSIIAVEDGAFLVHPGYLDKDDAAVDASSAIPYQIANCKSARILSYVYKTDGTLDQVVELSSADAEAALASMTAHSTGLVNPTKVLIYHYAGSVKLICILGETAAE